MDRSRTLDDVLMLLAILLEERSRVSKLTHREAEIVKLVLRGFSNKQIAALCCISGLTVRDHLRHAYQKMGIHRRSEVLGWLIGDGHLDDRDNRTVK